ncbi:MAG: hypothetical protein PGN11_08545, partial [Quadrisphaera sp.]
MVDIGQGHPSPLQLLADVIQAERELGVDVVRAQRQARARRRRAPQDVRALSHQVRPAPQQPGPASGGTRRRLDPQR